MKEKLLLSLTLFLIAPAFAFEKDLSSLKINDGSICLIFKNKILKVKPYVAKGTPDGSQGVQVIFLKKNASSSEKICNSDKSNIQVAFPDLKYIGYSANFAFFEPLMSAPGTGSLSVVNSATGKTQYELGLFDLPYKVTETKITFYDFQKHLEDKDCDGNVTGPGLGCSLVVQTELDLRSGKKRLLGDKKKIAIQ